MSQYRIGILKGDDIGLEIVPVAVDVVKTAVGKYPEVVIDWVDLPIGYPSYVDTGETLPQKTLDTLHDLDGWILGPIGHMAYLEDDPKAVNPRPNIEKGMDKVLGESQPVTPDLSGTAKTGEMGEAVCQALLSL